MAKNKNKGNVVQMLSPENFIRKRARSLPIYECFVNKNWQMSQMVNLVVARQHTSGNITAGVFLVDHACLGVKGTFWIFNVSMTEYQRFVKKFVDIDDGINKIDYALAHNIVYAGIEFAADYEFKPHKDFTSVSQYILEEDTDDIPVIEIECGIDGCPAYMQGPMHTDKMSQQVVAHLERVAGPGNYYLMNGVGNITNNDGFGIGDEDDEGDEDDQFSNMTFDEKSKEFLHYRQKKGKLSERDDIYFYDLFKSLLDDLIDEEKYVCYYDDLWNEIYTIPVNADEIHDEMLGVEPGSPPVDEMVKEQFLQIIDEGDNTGNMKKLFKQFRKNCGVEAAVDYLDLLISISEQSKDYEKKLRNAAEKYPHYALVQFRWNKSRLAEHNYESGVEFPIKLSDYFKDRKTIHPWEKFCFIDLLTQYVLTEKDLEKTEAMRELLAGCIEEDKTYLMLYTICLMFQLELVDNYCRNVS